MRNFLLCALATLGLALGATVVWGVGSAVTLDPSTGKTYPQQVSAGYLATADGGVVAVLNSPAPTAAGEGLVTTDATHAVWSPVPVGSGTVNYIPKWTPDGSHLGNATMSESGASLYRQLAAGNLVYLDLFNSTTATAPKVYLRHSLDGTIGSLIATTTNTIEGTILWEGVSSSPGFALGASIQALQFGAAGASYVPTKLTLATSSASAYNGAQLVLNPDNSVSMSGPVSASNIVTASTANGIPEADSAGTLAAGWMASGTPQVGQVAQVGINTSWQTGTTTATSTSLTYVWPPTSGPPLSNSSPMYAGLGGYGSAGSSNAAMRADAVIPLPFPTCKPGQTLRYGTMTATGTGTATATTTTITCQNN